MEKVSLKDGIKEWYLQHGQYQQNAKTIMQCVHRVHKRTLHNKQFNLQSILVVLVHQQNQNLSSALTRLYMLLAFRMCFQNCLLTVNASTKLQEQNSSVLLKQL